MTLVHVVWHVLRKTCWRSPFVILVNADTAPRLSAKHALLVELVFFGMREEKSTLAHAAFLCWCRLVRGRVLWPSCGRCGRFAGEPLLALKWHITDCRHCTVCIAIMVIAEHNFACFIGTRAYMFASSAFSSSSLGSSLGLDGSTVSSRCNFIRAIRSSFPAGPSCKNHYTAYLGTF